MPAACVSVRVCVCVCVCVLCVCVRARARADIRVYYLCAESILKHTTGEQKLWSPSHMFLTYVHMHKRFCIYVL